MADNQEQRQDSAIDYYDVMIIGMTGQGKSTTADKLIIANPMNKDYSDSQHQVCDTQSEHLRVDDISMWLLSGDREKSETRLKFLSFCRTQDKPHERVNKVRNHDPSKGPETLASTKKCEVISNDTSKVRVLDVPGFFDGESVKSPTSPLPSSPLEVSATKVQNNNLGIMRKILHAQTALNMKFRRILYFLPVRGPLDRANAILKLDLQLMAHYFGKAILECMVIVTTISAHISKLSISDSEKFPEEEREKTRIFFQQAINDIFPQPATEEKIKVPPIVFISLTDSCETILENVQNAPVTCDRLQLEFVPNVCTDCGVKVGVVQGEKVACSFGEDWSNAIPYNESTCHPALIPKHSKLEKIVGKFVHVVTFGWARGKEWPVFEGEICANCRKEPGTHGCMKVGRPFQPRRGTSVTVDHRHIMTELVNETQNDAATENQPVHNEQSHEVQHINPRFDGVSVTSQSQTQ